MTATTTELLDELGARAAETGHTLCKLIDHSYASRTALEDIADKHLRPLLDIAEAAPCSWSDPVGRCNTRTDDPGGWCPRCTALAALHTDLEAALKEVRI